MRYDAPYLVKRYAHPIGRADQPMCVAVEYQAYSVEDALRWAVYEQQRSANPPDFRAWLRGSQRWIERRGQPAIKK